MSKSRDVKKEGKKAAKLTPQEKRELKRAKRRQKEEGFNSLK